jgi:hypothetical protein
MKVPSGNEWVELSCLGFHALRQRIDSAPVMVVHRVSKGQGNSLPTQADPRVKERLGRSIFKRCSSTVIGVQMFSSPFGVSCTTIGLVKGIQRLGVGCMQSPRVQAFTIAQPMAKGPHHALIRYADYTLSPRLSLSLAQVKPCQTSGTMVLRQRAVDQQAGTARRLLLKHWITTLSMQKSKEPK